MQAGRVALQGEAEAARSWLAGRRLPLTQVATWAPLAAIVLLAAALRVYGLRTHSLWLDEIDEGTTAQAPFPDFFLHVRYDAAAAPLDYLGVKLMTSVLGHGTVATRSWALLMGVAAVPLIYVAGRRIFDSHAVGLAAAFLLALSAFHVYYSQEARFYSLAVVVVLLNVIALAHALARPGPLSWLLYAITCALAFYSYYFIAFLLPLEGLLAVGVALWSARGRSWGGRAVEVLRTAVGCGGAQALAVLAFLPWVLFALTRQLYVGYPLIPDLTPDRAQHVAAVVLALTSPFAPATDDETRMATCVLGLAVIGLVLGVVQRRFLALLLATGAIAAVPLAWRADQAARYFWTDRQVIVALPLVLLLAAAGYVGIVRGLVRGLRAAEDRGWLRAARLELPVGQVEVAVAGFGAGLALAWSMVAWPHLNTVYAGAWIRKEDWWGATAFISSSMCPSTTVYSQLTAQYSYGVDYYRPDLAPRTRFIGYDVATIQAAVVRSKLTPSDWIVLHPVEQGGGSQASLDRYLMAHGWRRTRFSGITVYHGPVCGQASSA